MLFVGSSCMTASFSLPLNFAGFPRIRSSPDDHLHKLLENMVCLDLHDQALPAGHRKAKVADIFPAQLFGAQNLLMPAAVLLPALQMTSHHAVILR